jgi:hypothetical protein
MKTHPLYSVYKQQLLQSSYCTAYPEHRFHYIQLITRTSTQFILYCASWTLHYIQPKHSSYATVHPEHKALLYSVYKHKPKHVESQQSHFIHTQSHWSSGSTLWFPSWGTQVQSPGGYLCETGILLLALSRYIGDPDVIDHCGLVWSELRPEPSLSCHADNVIIPLDLTQLFCPGFTLAAGPPSGFTTDKVGCGGEPCGEPSISLHSYTVSLVQWVNPLLPVMRDLGLIHRRVLMWNRDSPVCIVSLQKQFILYCTQPHYVQFTDSNTNTEFLTYTVEFLPWQWIIFGLL